MNMEHRILISKDELTKISRGDSPRGSHSTSLFCGFAWAVHLAESAIS